MNEPRPDERHPARGAPTDAGPPFERGRLRREARTIEAMVDIYCRRAHASPLAPCPDCREILDYALERLRKCPYRESKPTCANCTVHCYRADMRERVREAMREAGPHMSYRHPHLAFMHLVIDSRRPAPDPPGRRKR